MLQDDVRDGRISGRHCRSAITLCQSLCRRAFGELARSSGSASIDLEIGGERRLTGHDETAMLVMDHSYPPGGAQSLLAALLILPSATSEQGCWSGLVALVTVFARHHTRARDRLVIEPLFPERGLFLSGSSA